jgi:hypothetical protein
VADRTFCEPVNYEAAKYVESQEFGRFVSFMERASFAGSIARDKGCSITAIARELALDHRRSLLYRISPANYRSGAFVCGSHVLGKFVREVELSTRDNRYFCSWCVWGVAGIQDNRELAISLDTPSTLECRPCSRG